MSDHDSQGHATHTQVHIVIDKAPKVSPNPTTGAELYALGSIAAGYELYREVRGKVDDEPIANGATTIELKDGDHFYSVQKTLNPGSHRE
jgi:hypothetical protein